jgi:hypothetical protein
MDYVIIKDIEGLYIHVKTPYNSPIKINYAGYTFFPWYCAPSS